MPPQIATLVFAVLTLGLFALDRDRSARTSKALWLPVVWVWIVGSRPVSSWLGVHSGAEDMAVQLAEGSPFDAAVFTALLAAAIVVLVGRRKRTLTSLKASWPIIVYFSYCFISLTWSDFPGVGFKRWLKAIGDLAMVLIVATDSHPIAALKRFLSRVGFVLLPASILLIKYFGDMGRAFDPYGSLSVTGVTTNKNLLGVTTMILSLGAVWRILAILAEGRQQPDRTRHLLAQGILLVFGIAVLAMAHSATSGACFALGTGLMIATRARIVGRRPAAVHMLILVMALAAGLTVMFGGDADVVHAMGRQTDFTGRTAIWKVVIPMVPNPLIGAGFESFWLGSRLEKIWHLFPVFRPNEAHNGYIEVYLNLGCVGLVLIGLMLANGYWHAVSAFRRNRSVGGLALAYVACAAIYSVTEAGFRLLNPIWIFLLLAIVVSRSIPSSIRKRISRPRPVSASPVSSLLSPSAQTVTPAGGSVETF
jgi:exopolysaccharide production protein ExoQ